ncbi:MAG TPA: helix-turn-helix transcriptional regulator [Gemmatimonadaceae bacterium]|nr:helix-turn-helix transcriptional regulator [Gemmatimonadaceae bacterium]
MPTTTTRPANTLLLALDLGNTTWKLGFPSKRKGMSQGELERRSRVSYVTINAIANQRTTLVDLNTLDKLSAEPCAVSRIFTR